MDLWSLDMTGPHSVLSGPSRQIALQSPAGQRTT